eukprot:scaffold19398_cov51-Phaeocystis_antarctica.AAC.3
MALTLSSMTCSGLGSCTCCLSSAVNVACCSLCLLSAAAGAPGPTPGETLVLVGRKEIWERGEGREALNPPSPSSNRVSATCEEARRSRRVAMARPIKAASSSSGAVKLEMFIGSRSPSAETVGKSGQRGSSYIFACVLE